MTEGQMEYRITSEHSGMLLRTYLSSVLGISRGELICLKAKENGIMLNGSRVTVRAVLNDGDVLLLDRTDEDGSQGVVPVDLPLDVIYEDGDVIALNKPPHMPTHPSHDHQTDTLANALAHYYCKKGVPFVFRAVNRLDRDTSGIVIVAKSKASAFYMSRQIAADRVEKRYIAVASGKIDEPFSVKVNMKREEESKMRRTICDGNEGQFSHTDFSVICSRPDYTVLSALLHTGRTHQIRLHLAHSGHPLLGDTLYGDENGSKVISRQALHAHTFTFTRQCDGQRITLTAEPPQDLMNLLNNIKDN